MLNKGEAPEKATLTVSDNNGLINYELNFEVPKTSVKKNQLPLKKKNDKEYFKVFGIKESSIKVNKE